jgi:prepilin-type N-terminal cleavage/methylation domain-containing protein
VFPQSSGFPVEAAACRAVASRRRVSAAVLKPLRATSALVGPLQASPQRERRGPRHAVALGTPKPFCAGGLREGGTCHAVALGTPKPFRAGGLREGGFTLIELLVVIGIIAILMVLVAPAFTTIKSGTDVTSAAYTIKGALDTARTYAKANNTYVWVVFYEEDVSQSSTNPATPGTGRLVMSMVASKDGTKLYTGVPSTPVTLDPPNSATLLQVGKLAKIDNSHLITFPNATATPPPDTFQTRPAISSNSARIGNNAPPNPCLICPPPTGSSSPQYTFVKVVQFSPGGEAVIDDSNYSLTTVSEIGLQSTHGITPEPSPVKNPVAVQFTALGGDVKIYQK